MPSTKAVISKKYLNLIMMGLLLFEVHTGLQKRKHGKLT